MDKLVDLEALRRSIRDVLAAECPPDHVLKHVENGGGVDTDLWTTAASLGWTALPIAENLGGLGLGLDALAVLYEEAGRAVAPLPLLPTLLTADALALCGSVQQQQRWLTPIAEGRATGALSLPAPIAAATVAVVEAGGRLVLSGSDENVLDGAAADILLVLARRSDRRLVRVVLEPKADNLTLVRRDMWDATRHLATIALEGLALPFDRLIPVDDASEAALALHGAIAMAADSIGAADAALTMTLAYLKTREQFGKPIGSFQALKHRVANLKVDLVADTQLVRSAAALAAAGDPLAESDVAAAKAQACRNAVELARDALQLHGGIGFTAEHVCHLYLKRARLNEALFGGSAYHSDKVLSHLLARSAA